MFTIQRIIVAIVLTAVACTLPAVTQASEEEVGKLHAVLRSDASIHEKAVACKRLAVIGTKDSVPVLAELLTHEKLSHYARFGLEANPDSGVDRVFRAALEELAGKQLVGVINSIGQRRDSQAVAPLSDLLRRSDPNVSSAAAAALGRIADPRSVEILLERLNDKAGAVPPAIADACLACAEALLAQDRPGRAIEVYDAVRQSDLPKRFRIAATYSALRTRGSSALPLLREQLQSGDDQFFDVALQAARDLMGDAVGKVLLAELDRQRPSRKALLIAALGDRGDKPALPALREAARDESEAVRLAAIRALAQVGDSSVVELLLEAALRSDNVTSDNVTSDNVTADAARGALEVLSGTQIDAAIVSRLNRAGPPRVELLIQLVGSRRITAAVPNLLAAAESPHDSIRLAAIRALGETIGGGDLEKLVRKALSSTSPEERAAVGAALTAACIRVPDREGAVEKIVPHFSERPAAVQAVLFEVLGEVGGQAALRRVVAGARDGSEAVQDAATRVLGDWLTVDVAPELLELAQTLESERFQVRAMRGYIRIIRQFGLPVDQRVAMSRRALRVAKRDEEKKLVLQALVRFPVAESLALAAQQLAAPPLRGAAAQAAVSIAERLADREPEETRRAMRRVLEARVNKPLADRANAVLDKLSR